jgi:alpha-tubulin suppressor-like RCC1 family protein
VGCGPLPTHIAPHRPLTATPVAAGVSATAIALAGGHTCAIEADGGVKCWGRNDYGQLGIGSIEQQTSPVSVPGAGVGGGGGGDGALSPCANNLHELSHINLSV